MGRDTQFKPCTVLLDNTRQILVECAFHAPAYPKVCTYSIAYRGFKPFDLFVPLARRRWPVAEPLYRLRATVVPYDLYAPCPPPGPGAWRSGLRPGVALPLAPAWAAHLTPLCEP